MENKHSGGVEDAGIASTRLANHTTKGKDAQNRDRGGIQCYSEPTSTPGPLLKIIINYEGCSGLSNALKTASGPGVEHRKNRNASTRNDTTSPK